MPFLLSVSDGAVFFFFLHLAICIKNIPYGCQTVIFTALPVVWSSDKTLNKNTLKIWY